MWFIFSDGFCLVEFGNRPIWENIPFSRRIQPDWEKTHGWLRPDWGL